MWPAPSNISHMSTVLRPVGPLEPRVYWLRRATLITIVLVLIIVLAESCGGGGGKKNGGKKNGAVVHTTTSPKPTPSSTQLAACDPTALTLTLSTDATSYSMGQEPKLIGTFHNPGTSACTFSLAPSHEDWTIKSGSDDIWSTTGCASSQLVKGVTIKADGKKKVSITWDGRRLADKCAAGDPAQPGEYTLSATLDGVTAATAAIFHITAPQ
jgi:hypothetical protein